MSTGTELFYEGMLSHQIQSMGFSNLLTKDLVKHLEESEDELRGLLLHYADVLYGKNLATKTSKAKLATLLRKIQKVRASAWEHAALTLPKEFFEFGINEAQMWQELATQALGVREGIVNRITSQRVTELVTDIPFEGKVLGKWLLDAQAHDASEIHKRFVLGLVQGDSKSDPLAQVFGTRAFNYKDGVTKKAKDGLSALTYTGINHVQNQVSSAQSVANPIIVKEEYFKATLDSGTTIICMGYSNQIFKVGKGPIPPLHFRCRSLRLPKFTSEFLGRRAFDPSTENELLKEWAKNNKLDIKTRSQIPHGRKGEFDRWAHKTRSDRIGRAPAELNYSKFLKARTKGFQDEVLGKARAAAFRAGKIQLHQFVNRQNRLLTIKELRARGFDI